MDTMEIELELLDFILKLKHDKPPTLPVLEITQPKGLNYVRTYSIFSSVFENIGLDFTKEKVVKELSRREVKKWLQDHKNLGNEVLGIVYAQYQAWKSQNSKISS